MPSRAARRARQQCRASRRYDAQAATAAKDGCGIRVGRTFSDYESDMHFTVLGKNTPRRAEQDVSMMRGPFFLAICRRWHTVGQPPQRWRQAAA